MLTLIFSVLICKLGKAKLIDREFVAISIILIVFVAIFDLIVIDMILGKIGACYGR